MAKQTINDGIVINELYQFKCNYCDYSSKYHEDIWSAHNMAKKHLAICQSNPANRKCKTCRHVRPVNVGHFECTNKDNKDAFLVFDNNGRLYVKDTATCPLWEENNGKD